MAHWPFFSLSIYLFVCKLFTFSSPSPEPYSQLKNRNWHKVSFTIQTTEVFPIDESCLFSKARYYGHSENALKTLKNCDLQMCNNFFSQKGVVDFFFLLTNILISP